MNIDFQFYLFINLQLVTFCNMMIHKLGLDNQSMLDGPIQEALYYTFHGVIHLKEPNEVFKSLELDRPCCS